MTATPNPKYRVYPLTPLTPKGELNTGEVNANLRRKVRLMEQIKKFESLDELVTKLFRGIL